MGVGTSIINYLTGGSGSAVATITENITKYFPPSMTDQEKSELQLKIQEQENSYKIELLQKANEDVEAFNDRIKSLEGTSADLKSIPFIGPFLIMLRGIQRPAWGFAVMYIDVMVFAKKWDIQLESDTGFTPEGMTILLLNVLVLGFLFGERTLKNVVPVLIPLMELLYGKIKKS